MLPAEERRGSADHHSMTVQAPTLGDVQATRFDAKVAGIGVAARHRRAAGSARLRPDHVRLHLLALLQSRARQHLLPADAGLALVSHLVVADSGRQHHALFRRHDSFLARPLGALSAPAFPLHGGRDHAIAARAEHSALARESFRRHTRRRLALRLASLALRQPAVQLLGAATAHDRRPDDPDDGRVDACLHRPLLLAAHEAVLPVGRADPACRSPCCCRRWRCSACTRARRR